MTLTTTGQNLQQQPDDGEVLVRVENVSKKFCRSLKKSLWYGVQDIGSELMRRNHERQLRPDEFWSVKDVSFELRRGECLGLIGPNGAGKSTLLKMLNGLIKPDRGRIEISGRVAALIELGTGFNPILTGRENIYVNSSILGISKKDIDSKIDHIIDFAEIGEFIDSPVQNYSSGMKVRLGFSVATILEPDILLIDEVLAVGDAKFRLKAQQAIRKILARGTTMVMVSHNLHELSGNTNQCIWMERGKIRLTGETRYVCSEYLVSQTGRKNISAGVSGFYNYSPNRSGHIVLTNLKHFLTISNNKGGFPQLNLPNQLIELELEFEAIEPLDDRIVHAVNLKTFEGSYIGRAALKDFLNVEPGQVFSRTLKLRMPNLLPGLYRLEYFVWLEGGEMLEGMFNLFDFEMPTAISLPHFQKLNNNYFTEKMGDNTRGAIPLELAVYDS